MKSLAKRERFCVKSCRVVLVGQKAWVVSEPTYVVVVAIDFKDGVVIGIVDWLTRRLTPVFAEPLYNLSEHTL